MSKVDASILELDNVICGNIESLSKTNSQLMSQNILAYFRNFVEQVAIKIVFDEEDVDPLQYETIQKAMVKIRESKKEIKFIDDFHRLLQISESHYTMNGEGSERLLVRYYKYLLMIKKLLKDRFDMNVLGNIGEIYFTNNPDTKKYYEKIASIVDTFDKETPEKLSSDRYYIQKIKPFYVKERIYYEVTFIIANNKASKFDRITAFTNQDIFDNYAVKLSIHSRKINILGLDVYISIICQWEVSIKPCELNKFAKIFDISMSITAQNLEYRGLMKYLTDSKYSMVKLMDMPDSNYHNTMENILHNSESRHFSKVLNKCRDMISKNEAGSNVIRYLLSCMNDKIINQQYRPINCDKLSDLMLNYGCIPFDEMPFASSLVGHNPGLLNLLECIDSSHREHEFLARMIKNNTESNGIIFTPISEIPNPDGVKDLIEKYNSLLYWKHSDRKLALYRKYIYIEGYKNTFVYVLNIIKKYTESGLENYSDSVRYWIKNINYPIDSERKKDILIKMFESSHVALIYGSAGTGKSTLINHISAYFKNSKKLYLANTNPAVDNLKRKVHTSDGTFSTIDRYLSKKEYDQYDLLIIDECSTVSNDDLLKVLKFKNFKLLVLVGDVYQIESINFGNWFNVINSFIPSESVFELTDPYRTSDQRLIETWKKVRDQDEGISEYLIKYGYASVLDNSIVHKIDDDQIILCLNYNGLYGINNLNRILQSNNESEPVQWGLNIFKIGDPILFNESNSFSPIIYNNMKGVLKGICKYEDKIRFDVEVDATINGLDAAGHGFQLLSSSPNGKPVIRFYIRKCNNGDTDNDLPNTVIPFNIAYAVSIHKSQGLEYDTVKVIISDEIEEQITHNIFYTAITRARKNLKIYWNAETQNEVLNGFKHIDTNKDVQLLSMICGIRCHYKNHN